MLARLPELNEVTIKGIKGIAPSRLKANIEHFFTTNANAEKSGQPDAEDSFNGESA